MGGFQGGLLTLASSCLLVLPSLSNPLMQSHMSCSFSGVVSKISDCHAGSTLDADVVAGSLAKDVVWKSPLRALRAPEELAE